MDEIEIWNNAQDDQTLTLCADRSAQLLNAANRRMTELSNKINILHQLGHSQVIKQILPQPEQLEAEVGCLQRTKKTLLK